MNLETKDKSNLYEIDASQLAYLLGVNKSDAAKIIEATYRSMGLPDRGVIHASLLKGKTITDMASIIDNIRENYLKSDGTRRYIIEYPAGKLKKNKDGFYPSRIIIPQALRKFLSDETQSEIIKIWERRYRNQVREVRKTQSFEFAKSK